MKVQFTQNAQVRGRGYRRGDVAELDDATAEAYVRVQQCVPFVATVPSVPSSDEDTDKPAAPTTTRAGKKVRTATAPQGTTR